MLSRATSSIGRHRKFRARASFETFKKTTTADAVPLGHQQTLTFVSGFMNAAATNGTLRKAFDDHGMTDTPILIE